MATPSLLYNGVTRWGAAAVFVIAGGGLAILHATRVLPGPTAGIQAVLGSDSAALGRVIFEGPHGLAIRLSPEQRATLRREIARDPLSGELTALAALDAEARGDSALAKKLSHHAQAVEPRTKLAWLARLARQVRERRNIDATNSVLRLLAVDPANYAAYLPVLALMARDRRTIPTISVTLAGNPAWRTPFLDLLGSKKYDPSIRYALMSSTTVGRGATIASEDTQFVQNLVNEGDIDRAYLAWLSFLPDNALTNGGTPYDPDFRGLPGPAPFNWYLTSTEGDRATIANNMLSVSYSGRQATQLVGQVMLLQPGTYRIATTLAPTDQSAPPGSGTALSWRLACLPARSPIAEVPLDVAATGRAQASAPFVVPAEGCTAVSLTLNGTASEFPSRLSAAIRSVAVQPSAAAPAPLIATSSATPPVKVLP